VKLNFALWLLKNLSDEKAVRVVDDQFSNPTLADEKTLQCKIVMQAFSRFLSLVKQKEENPEEFGERILQAEMALADTLEEIHHQEQQLKALQTHSSDQLKKIQNKLEEMHAIYDIRESEIKTLLAVILESSPE